MNRLRLPPELLVLLAAAAAWTTPAQAQENTDCLACHTEQSLTGSRAGKTISVFVNEKILTGSVHGPLPCVACHADVAGKELPHGDDLAPVDCGSCHADVATLHA